jgi:hypothetical protein
MGFFWVCGWTSAWRGWMTSIFGILESSATQWYQELAPTWEFFFFIVTSIVYAAQGVKVFQLWCAALVNHSDGPTFLYIFTTICVKYCLPKFRWIRSTSIVQPLRATCMGSQCRLQKVIGSWQNFGMWYMTSRVVKGSKDFGPSPSFARAARKSWTIVILLRAPSSDLGDPALRWPWFLFLGREHLH